MPEIIVLFGKPGAGKGTRSDEFLATTDKTYKLLSVGDTLREALANQTELGLKAESYMKSGALVPDDVIIPMVIDAIKTSTEPIISDGFPRTVGQAQAMLDAGIVPMVIEFYVEDNVVIQRIKDRIVCKNKKCNKTYTLSSYKPPKVPGICDVCGSPVGRRPDDELAMENRLEVYRNETLPVLNFLCEHGIDVHTIDNSNAEQARVQFAKLMNG